MNLTDRNNKILELNRQGLSSRDIAKQVGVSKTRVQQILNREKKK